jgi:CRISPR-associated protein (TIGR03986 family)
MVFSKALQKAGVVPETSQQPTQKTNQPSQPSFHNPYNFVPALPRSEKVTGTELGDHSPVGHHAYLSDHWTGKISVTLKTKTPLLINDAANVSIENEHKTFSVRLGADQRPYLAPTSIKGMLRSAYEIVTNSRLSIFAGHEDRLAYRNPPSPSGGKDVNKPKLIPAIVIKSKSDNTLLFRILQYEKLSNYGYSIRLPRYPENPLKYSGTGNQLPEHGDKVWVTHTAKGVADRIYPWSQEAPEKDSDWKIGWVCITGRNINNKRYERVFIKSNNDREIPITDEHVTFWKQLICNYKKANERALKKRAKRNQSYKDYLGSSVGETSFSRHIGEDNTEVLKIGTLCYLTLNKQGQIMTLSPVTISRQLHSSSPDSLLDDSLNLKPAISLEQLSPVDRVFGWVNQKGSGAYKGQLRVETVQCESGNAIEILNPPVSLAILSSPKPEQARFYVSQDQRGNPLSEAGKAMSYSAERGIRGRKIYPHHTKGLNFKEWQRTNNEKDEQNFSVQGWVKQGVSFTFTIDVINLSSIELGALLWILDLGDNYYHRLGAGKPLGFGSVGVKVNWDKTNLYQGQQWANFYDSLNSFLPKQTGFLSCIDLYKKEFRQLYGPKQDFESNPIIQAFCQAAQGFQDDLPIHYPRLEVEKRKNDKEDHPVFDWFRENESLNQDIPGSKLALPALWQEVGLPYDPTVAGFLKGAVKSNPTQRPTKKKP